MDDAEAQIRQHIGCTTPLPLRCPLCRRGNLGFGLDYCLFSAWKATFGEQVREECARLVESHEVVHAGIICEIAAQIRKLEIK